MVDANLAKKILHLGKNLAPDRFPVPSPEVKDDWAIALNRELPDAVWRDAVLVWATELVGDRMCTPRDILNAARIAVQRWESTPAGKAELERFRAVRLEEKYRRMLGPAYRPGAVPPRDLAEIEPPNDRDFEELKRRLAEARKR
ncbi:hypothetical protein [Corynebacterium flavescens]|uniref:Uncharacterized protein n=1 Tax=Corynebacterium flavescens TaxID=28028 RepID=A0A1L7CNJ3_CORFL|nr:hypothetical protein [Corynebacterium flavescens]APT87416.1 hypothetical protein CFLV_09675 [Corynebacterium flavescens]KAA8720504.1 hypothetical protein F4V60_09400 [Corynebacterium flavescens]GEB97728.1 hypothetical protein CFL01nite_12230 [Corynebacterium flavescens]